ncbi:MAG: hypothetical protein GX241_00365 [Ruminococcaceae bacterium]|nr:hypothetical protein [Oscillospiraceae bacterium]
MAKLQGKSQRGNKILKNQNNQRNHKTKKTQTKKNSFSIILTIAIIGLMGYFVISLISLQIEIRDRQQQVDAANQIKQEKELENKELERFLAEGDESSYIERVARDVLGYVLPGERVYYDISSGD